jgi:site-specific recombinase XerD
MISAEQWAASNLSSVDNMCWSLRCRSITTSTWRSYKKPITDYLQVSNRLGILPLPLSPRALSYTICYWHICKKLTSPTISKYVSAIRTFHRIACGARVTEDTSVTSILQGVLRSSPPVIRSRATSLPASAIVGIINSNPASESMERCRRIFTICFAMCLRIGDLYSLSPSNVILEGPPFSSRFIC